MRKLFLLSCLASGLLLILPASLAAQAPDPWANAKVHYGPLAMTPSFAVTNLGIDTNVFNSVDNPQQDFTITLEPSSDIWMHFGRGLLSGHFGEGLVYFKKFKSERSIDSTSSLRFDLPLNRLAPYIAGQYTNAHQRPNLEIDARVRYKTTSATAGFNLRLFGRTSIGAYGRTDQTLYNRNETFFGSNLARSLNRRGTAVGLTVREPLTPFTTVTLTGEESQDRFELDTEKNSNSLRGTLGIELNPAALISGKATVGYREFRALGAGVQSYRGVTASVDLGYTLLGRTRLGVQVQRDVDYSFDVATPYYVLTGVSGSVTERLFGPVDLVVRGGHQTLAYRGIIGAVTPDADRTDKVDTYGGGLAYQLGHDLRLGFNVDQNRRLSTIDARRYNDLRAGMSVTYGGSE